MKSIGELKSLKLERCSFEDIFEDYEDTTQELKEQLNEYLSQFTKPNSNCIRCEAKLNTLESLPIRCIKCGYPHERNHTVIHNNQKYHFHTLALQVHPSELRG